MALWHQPEVRIFQSLLGTLLNLWPLAIIMLFVFCIAVVSFFLLKQFYYFFFM